MNIRLKFSIPNEMFDKESIRHLNEDNKREKIVELNATWGMNPVKLTFFNNLRPLSYTKYIIRKKLENNKNLV